jgi:hypothetical protein
VLGDLEDETFAFGFNLKSIENLGEFLIELIEREREEANKYLSLLSTCVVYSKILPATTRNGTNNSLT